MHKINSKYQIDQSGRIEYTSHDTVVAFANGIKGAVIIKASEKRIIQQLYRQAGKGATYVYRVFALLIFILLREKKFDRITIDTEYPGKGDIIKNYILQDFKRFGREIESNQINFQRIGKNCEAHWHDYYVFKKKRKADISLKASDILREVLI